MPVKINLTSDDKMEFLGVSSIGGKPLNGWAKIIKDLSLDERFAADASKNFPGSSSPVCSQDTRMHALQLASCGDALEIETECGSGECCGSETRHLFTLSNSGEVLKFETRSFDPE